MPDPSRRSRRLRLSSLALLGLIAVAGNGCVDAAGNDVTPPADSAAGEQGFRLAGAGGAAIVVPVHINGRGPIDLILDTGATLTCLDTSLVRELALPERRLTFGAAVGVGGGGRVGMHRVDSLRIAGAVTRNINVCALDLGAMRVVAPTVRGLLGLNVLRNFTVTLDFQRSVVRLAASGV
jgi:predicted aspartyl protease